MLELDGRPVMLTELGALALQNFGHFTSFRIENLHVRGLSLHLDRLVHDCRVLFDAELDPQRVRRLLRQALRPEAGPVVARVTVFDPGLDLGHPGRRGEPHILISTRQAAGGSLSPLRLGSVSYRRELPRVKHVGLFGAIHHRRAAQLAGYDDAIFVDSGSWLSEGPTWNVGFFDGTQLIWPRADVLTGVTMRLLTAAAGRLGISSTWKELGIPEVTELGCAFATNAAIGVRPIRSLDHLEFVNCRNGLQVLQEVYAGILPDPL